MTAEQMEARYREEYADAERRERADEEAAEQALVDALYGELEELPGTVVRGLDAAVAS